jgi:aldehyde:ferredoxin oxidoreductase
MQVIHGTSNRVLTVNLTLRTVDEITISEEDRRLYLGGKGLALSLLYDRQPPGVDPLSEDNILAVMTGVLMGTGAPCSGRFAAVSKSPLTGIYTSSSCGGPFGMALKTAGYDGILLIGRAAEPTILWIDADGVRFEAADHLWGLDAQETQDALQLGKKDGALVIGPAGENLVRYANIVSGHRFLGRGGLGAVMGAKNLKAVAARGGAYRIMPLEPETFKRAKTRGTRYINANHFTANLYRQYGTSVTVNYNNRSGILPVRNFRGGSDERAAALSGEAMRERYDTKHSTCLPCTILCGHKGNVNGKTLQVPEYETTGHFGSNLEIFDPDLVIEWNDLCGRLGMDTISAGVTLAYAMEATERGMMSSDLRFGSSEEIAGMLTDIAHRRGLGDDLANGTRWLAQKYGGAAFAMHVKGMELGAYDPRGSWGQGLSYAVANRGGCHLSGTTFAIETIFGFLNPYTTRAKANFVRVFENLYAAVNSMHACAFTTFAYTLEPPLIKYTPAFLISFAMEYLPEVAIQLLDFGVFSKQYAAVTGISLSQRDFLRAGERVHMLERYMNTLEGVRAEADTLPARLLVEGRESDPRGRTVPLEKMLPAYYRMRGYAPDGVPTVEVLSRLGIPVRHRHLVEHGAIDRGRLRRDIQPRRKPLKRTVVTAVLFTLGRALQAAARLDPTVAAEVAAWPERYRVAMAVQPRGPHMLLEKDESGRLRYRGMGGDPSTADLVIYFKNLESAFLVLTAQMGTSQGYAEHRMSAKGDLSIAASLIRCLETVEAYLFPSPLARRLMRRLPRFEFWRKQWVRLMIYLVGIPIGL